MRFTLFFILIFLVCISYSQVTFQTIPLDKQLVGRDSNTNVGNIVVSGEVNSSLTDYDSITLEILRNDLQYNTISQALIYEDKIAQFNLTATVEAELANYSLKIYGTTGNNETLEKTVDSIVAGDAFIIQGQSNAEATLVEGSSNSYLHPFIRVYANGTHFPNEVANNNKWYIGQGDGNRNTNGNTGQWGLKLARMLVDSLNIPIAIFNAGHGGKEIDFFPAPPDYQTSLASNYGRLYFRINKTGLRDFVRAVFWSQGEWDGEDYGNTTTDEYKNTFMLLKYDWLNDYPNIEHFYLFQTKNGCGGNLHKIKEAQRQLAVENQDISIMSTAALTHSIDECHFPFADGYELFADRILPLVQHDLYNVATQNRVNPPMIISANLINKNTLVVGTDANELSINTIAEDFLLSTSTSATITNIEASFNEIIFTLSENPGADASISYLAQDAGPGNFITNKNGLELVCFYQYPITDLTGINGSEVHPIIISPNPATEFITISGMLKNEVYQINIYNNLGRKEMQVENNFDRINVSELRSGLYILEFKTKNSIIKRKILIK